MFKVESLANECGKGNLHCRFEDNPADIRSLGRFLKDLQKGKRLRQDQFQPFFEISQYRSESEENLLRQLQLSPALINDMIDRGYFAVDSPSPVEIPLQNEDSRINIKLCLYEEGAKPVLYGISGFPRKFVQENKIREPQDGGLTQERVHRTISPSEHSSTVGKLSEKTSKVSLLEKFRKSATPPPRPSRLAKSTTPETRSTHSNGRDPADASSSQGSDDHLDKGTLDHEDLSDDSSLRAKEDMEEQIAVQSGEVDEFDYQEDYVQFSDSDSDTAAADPESD